MAFTEALSLQLPVQLGVIAELISGLAESEVEALVHGRGWLTDDCILLHLALRRSVIGESLQSRIHLAIES